MDDMTRNAVIARLRAALKARSGKVWSVTGGTGTAYGWITIDAPPAARTWRRRLRAGLTIGKGYEDYEEYDSGQRDGHTSPAQCAELAALLGLPSVHHQGVSIPAGHDYYREYLDRAEGRTPAMLGTPYWD